MSRIIKGMGGGPRKTGKAMEAMKKKLLSKTGGQAARGSTNTGSVAKPDFKVMIEETLAQKKREMMLGSNGKKFSLPGTKEVALSESYKRAVEDILARRERKRLKKLKAAQEEMEVKGRYLSGGGRVDSQGRVWGTNGKVVLTIDKKSGKVKNHLGTVVMTYDPTKPDSLFKLEQLVKKYSQPMKGPLQLGQQQQNNGWYGGGGSGGGGWYGGGGSGGGGWYGGGNDGGNNGW